MREAIRSQMTAQGWTVTALAKAVGLKRPYLSQRLNGHAEFKTGELALIGAALGVPSWELMRRAEAALALAGGAHTPPAPETQPNNSAATVAAGPHTEVES